MKLMYLMIFSVLLAPSNMALAEDSNKQTQAEIKNLQQMLQQSMPQAAGSQVKATPVNGIYEVITGSRAMYMTSDGRYIFDGDLIDMKERRNLTEDVRSSARKTSLDSLGEDNMLVYTPEGKVKHTITVFTDIYCPYCRKLHDEMSEYMAAGVKVRYIFLPFKGKKSFDDSVSVWCAGNRQEALDKAKSGGNVEAKTCAHPIDKHKELATTLSIRGTPAIMYENGSMSPGYVPVAKVIETLNSPVN